MSGNAVSRRRASASERAARGRRGTARRRRHERIDLEHYVPTIVSSFADKLRTSSVAFLRNSFGISRLEWRVLSFLIARGGAPSAYLIWNTINADKGALSRTLQSLADKKLVRVREAGGGTRRRTRIELTPRGRRLQAATVGVIRERERRLLEGVSAAEVDGFIAVIRRLEANIPKMDAATRLTGSRHAATAGAGARASSRRVEERGGRARRGTRTILR